MADRSIVVTGALGVLGIAIARRFVRESCVVTIVDAVPAIPAEVAAEFCLPHAIRAPVDLTDLGVAQAIFAGIAQPRGIDVLVNVAGGFRWELLTDSDLAVWDAMYQTNLRTAVVSTSAALPYLKSSQGRIINIGAGAAAHRATRGMGAYAAAKSGVHRFTESLADELKDFGVTVNAVLPGTVDTPANRREMPGADFARWVAPEAIADVVWFLASDAARAVNGALIPVVGRS